MDGFEGQLTALLTDNLELNATASYTNFVYDDSALLVRLVPEWKYSVGGRYTLPVSYGSWIASVNYAWRDKYYNNSLKSTIATDPWATTDSVGLVDARFTVQIDAWDTDISLFGTNLTDKEYHESPLVYMPPYVNNTAVGEPRMFGVEVKKRF